tara:strand:+ start:2293 stop:2874 length:582 start_codon:yes stop_codon:yes gene_type:complete
MSTSISKKSGKGKIRKNKVKKSRGIWMKNVLTRRIQLPFHSVGSNIRENIQAKIEENLYNKCSKEGYIKNKSIKILSYSSGLVIANDVAFEVMFECEVCHPVEGQLIKCQAKNITRAGIRAIYTRETPSPITIFIARDHHYNNEAFLKVKENDDITIRVIGIRYELNDETIAVLGELKNKVEPKKTKVTILEE